jgi:hypothetical protein
MMKKILLAFAGLEACLIAALVFFIFFTDKPDLPIYSLIIGLIVLTFALGLPLLFWKKK